MRIEEDLMAEIRRRALAERISINRMINRLLRAALHEADLAQEPPFKQEVHDMGVPRVDLAKAHAVLAAFDDEDFVRLMKDLEARS